MVADANPRPRSGAVAYLRTSTREQDLSPDAQLHAIQGWAESRGVEILDVFSDVGVSSQAPVQDRPELPLAIAAVKRLRAQYLLAAVSDRLHRRASVAEEIRTLTALAGGRVVTADGVEDGLGDGPSAWLLTRILDTVAEFEVLMIRARTRNALEVRRRQGLVIGGVPYGSREKLEVDGQGRPVRRLVEDARELEAMRLVAELRRAGCSYAAISSELIAAGFMPRGTAARGRRRWHAETLRRMAARAEASAPAGRDSPGVAAAGSRDD